MALTEKFKIDLSKNFHAEQSTVHRAGRGAEISNGMQELFFTFHPAQPWLHVAVRGAGKCTCVSLSRVVNSLSITQPVS